MSPCTDPDYPSQEEVESIAADWEQSIQRDFPGKSFKLVVVDRETIAMHVPLGLEGEKVRIQQGHDSTTSPPPPPFLIVPLSVTGPGVFPRHGDGGS